MDNLAESGGHPQKADGGARGVVLTQAELVFLELLSDPLRDDESFASAGHAAGLTDEQIGYVEEWVANHGVHWLTCESAGYDPKVGARVFRNPLVSKIINAAADRGMCVGTIPSKEEVAGFLGQQLRNPFLPVATQQKAAETLAKMMGYFPAGSDGPRVGVQVILQGELTDG